MTTDGRTEAAADPHGPTGLWPSMRRSPASAPTRSFCIAKCPRPWPSSLQVGCGSQRRLTRITDLGRHAGGRGVPRPDRADPAAGAGRGIRPRRGHRAAHRPRAHGRAGTAQAPAAAGDRPRHRRSAGQRPCGYWLWPTIRRWAPVGGRPCTGALPRPSAPRPSPVPLGACRRSPTVRSATAPTLT